MRDQWDIASDIRMDIVQVLAEQGISIPYPHRIIHEAGSTGTVRGAHSYPQEVMVEHEEPEE